MRDTDSDWREWGKKDPYFGVVTHAQFRADKIDENRAEFFRTGEAVVSRSLKLIEQNFGTIPKGRALDFGCGVARLTIPLAQRFDKVLGLDISPAMLAEARKNAPGIDFALSDDDLSAATGIFDFVFTYIVLQHIPPERGLQIISKLLSISSHSCAIHISIGRDKNLDLLHKSRLANFIRMLPGGTQFMNFYHGNKSKRPKEDPVMLMHEYPLRAVLDIFRKHGFAEILIRPENHGGEETLFLLSTKSDQRDRKS